MTGTDEHPSRLDAAIESSLAKFVARFLTPLLLVALCFFVRGALVSQSEQGRDIVQIKSDVRDLNTRLDAGVIRQVNDNTNRLNSLESRVQQIERKVRP